MAIVRTFDVDTMRRSLIIVAVSVALLLGGGALIKIKVLPDPGAPLTVVRAAKDAYWIKGGVSNMGFIVGPSSVLVIDAQLFQETAQNSLSAIRAITNKPVRYVLLTHGDPDHVNGLAAFPSHVDVIVQSHARAEILKALDSWLPSLTSPPGAVRKYLPQRTIEGEGEIDLDDLKLKIFHFDDAHTDGDLVVYWPERQLVYAGDILTPEVSFYPGIHLNKQGSSLGWIRFVEAMLALDANLFISGHGEPVSRTELMSRLQAARERRAQIKVLFDHGQSLDEIRKALGDQPLPGPASRFPTFVETTFEELKAAERVERESMSSTKEPRE